MLTSLHKWNGNKTHNRDTNTLSCDVFIFTTFPIQLMIDKNHEIIVKMIFYNYNLNNSHKNINRFACEMTDESNFKNMNGFRLKNKFYLLNNHSFFICFKKRSLFATEQFNN